jgi:hypothetical protein
VSEPSELTKRIKKRLGELFRFSWEIAGAHAPGPGKDRSEAPQEEKPGDRAMADIGYFLR